MLLGMVLLALASEPLPVAQTVEAPARINWLLPSGTALLGGVDGKPQIFTCDPTKGTLRTQSVDLEPGFKAVAAGERFVLFDRSALVGVQIQPDGAPRVLWRKVYLAAKATSDPSDQERIVDVKASADTVAVVDTTGKFALLDPKDGSVFWTKDVDPSRAYILAVGARCGAVIWETQHASMIHTVDLYMEPRREWTRAGGMQGIFMASMTSKGVTYITPDRIGQILFDGRLFRSFLEVQTRPGAAYVMDDPTYETLVWSAGVGGLSMTPLPKDTIYKAMTPQQNWETLWVTDDGFFASNAATLCQWVAADQAKLFRGPGRPELPRLHKDAPLAVLRGKDGDQLAHWSGVPNKPALRALRGSTTTTSYRWLGDRLIGHDGKNIRVYAPLGN